MQTPVKIDDENAADLMQQVAERRCREAFSQLFRYLAPKLKGFFIAGHPITREVADELVQEVMWKVWTKASQFNPDKSILITWVYTIAKNTRIDWIRKHQRADAFVLSAEDLETEKVSGDLPFIALQNKRNQTAIAGLLNNLSDKQLEVVRMIFLEGKSHSEVASELDMPLGTVKSRLRLALEKLKSLRKE